MPEILTWLFDGLGTMLLGVAIGGLGGGAAGWRLALRRSRRDLRQKAGSGAVQIQAGRDVRSKK